MNRKSTIILCFALCFGVCLQLLAQQFSIRKYTAVDGLPQSEVRAIAEDQNGYLWIATQGGGLARFDGREFHVYTTLDGLLSNIVTTLFIDNKNTIWMAHPRGITQFDGRHFKRYQQPFLETGSRRIRRIFQQNDSIYFVTHPGVIGKIFNDSVYYWSRNVVPNKNVFFTHVRPGKSIVHYMSDSSFVYSLGSRQGKISHKNIFGRTLNVFTAGHDVMVKSDLGYFKIDMTNQKFISTKIPITRHIIYFDSTSNTYWTREGNKLMKERIHNDQVTTELVYDGAEISQIMPDGEGNMWIASMGDGLIRHYIQDFSKCSSDRMKMVMSIAQDHQGDMWIGSANNGLWRMHQGKIEAYPIPNTSDGVSSIKVTTAGEVYAAYRTGLGNYKRRTNEITWLNRSDGLSSSYISSIEPDNKGGLWVGTNMGGLNYYDGKTFTLLNDDAGIKNKSITALKFMTVTETLFIGTDYGVYEYKSNDKVQVIRFPEFDNTSILSLNSYQDSLLLVASGGAGFAVYNPKSRKRRVYMPKDGFPSGFVFFVAADEGNRIWLGTVNGISRILLNAKGDIIENRYYGFDNGLTGIESNQNAFYFGEKAKYFGLIDGLYEFNDLNTEQFKSYPTHLTAVEVLQQVDMANNYTKKSEGFFKVPASLSLPHTANQLTFHFNKVDKRNPQSVQYKYRLEGFDKSWSHPTKLGEVTYGNLPSGQYTFKILATQKDGSWESIPLTYNFTIQTPFYRTEWFIILMVLLCIAGILFGIMYRFRSRVAKVMEIERIRQREQEILRKEIARDFHDEMGNQLTRIINYVSLLKLSSNGHTQENGNGLGELFNKVELSAKNLYTGTRDFIWAIDPLNDELSQLFIHLRDFGVKLFEEKNINFRAFNQVRDSVRLPYGFSREANLVFKEAMTNAFKHSQANNVTLTLLKVDEQFCVELTDDGVGFSYSTITMNGLKNIRGRADKIKASLLIQGGPGVGTKVVLKFGIGIKEKQKVNKS